jgi:hypothetical protein
VVSGSIWLQTEQKMAAEKRLDDYTIDGDVHKVLINDEGQYSIWPAGQKFPRWMERSWPNRSQSRMLNLR